MQLSAGDTIDAFQATTPRGGAGAGTLAAPVHAAAVAVVPEA